MIVEARPSETSRKEVKPVAEKVKDPVCGMEIEPKQAAAKTQYQGKTYYFCSPGCKVAFEKNPTQYAG